MHTSSSNSRRERKGVKDKPRQLTDDMTRDSICRDFQKNICRRGNKCKFLHQRESNDGLPHDTKCRTYSREDEEIVFCHDFQNKGACSRANCKFVHCNRDEENEYLFSGFLPPRVREQVLLKGISADLSNSFFTLPVCKDHLNNTCRRNQCRFRHISSQQYDLELRKCIERKVLDPDPCHESQLNGYQRMQEMTTGTQENFECAPEQNLQLVTVGYGEPFEKRRRMDVVVDYGPELDIGMIQHENIILKQQMAELKKQISDLSTTNNFLLEQNSQLRMTIKAATGDGSAQGGPNGQQQQNQSPVVSMDLPAATVAQQGTTITMTMEVPPSSMPQSMSLPVAQLVTTMTGSPLVTSISMAPTQPTGTLVTSMSLAPTMQSAQPIMTSINLATPMEPGQMQPPPSLTLQAMSGPPPVSSMSTIHAVSRALPQPLVPNTVQVHETRLVSYPIMSVRPRL